MQLYDMIWMFRIKVPSVRVVDGECLVGFLSLTADPEVRVGHQYLSAC